jgi:hypothetical protein
MAIWKDLCQWPSLKCASATFHRYLFVTNSHRTVSNSFMLFPCFLCLFCFALLR